jgi:hypothetical protein
LATRASEFPAQCCAALARCLKKDQKAELIAAMRTGSRSATEKTVRGPKSRKPQTKNPQGGLTAAGREEFRRKEGAHLKPGVKKPQNAMSTEEMRRKGSWAVRFYGRAGRLPPLKDHQGRPTRFALTAAAWGEPAPNTAAAARKLASKGRKLLDRLKRRKRSA